MRLERTSDLERQRQLEAERREREQRERQRQENLKRLQQEDKKTTEDTQFTDKAGRPITLRNIEYGDRLMVRAYDTSRDKVPEYMDDGRAGRANAHLERDYGKVEKVRFNIIEVDQEYRKAGIANKMIDQVESYAQKHGAREVYGVIDNAEARAFWEHQRKNGWEIDPDKGLYGTARKRFF